MNGSESASSTLLQSLLLDACGKTTLLLLLVWGITCCFRRLGAAQQHFLWLFALLGTVYVTGAALIASAGSAGGLKSTPATLPVRVWRAPDLKRVAPPMFAPSATTPADGSAPSASTVVRHSVGLPLSDYGVTVFSLIWLLGALLSLLRLACHYRAVRLLQRRSVPLESAEIHALLAQLVARSGVARSPLLLQQEAVAFSPLTWGWRRAFLLLPAETATWPQERMRAVLLHELAHIRRGDWLTQRIADAVCALFWFHPLVWLAARKLRDCAERACDDAVLAQGITAESYARHLLDIAQMLRSRTADRAMTLPLLRISQLEKRLRAVLDSTASRRTFSRLWQYGIVAVGALCLLPLAFALPVTTQNVHYVDAFTAVNGKASLPGSVTVELLGIAATNAEAKTPVQWWLPDGTSTAAPYDLTNAFRVKDSETDHRIQRIFAVRISGVAEENPDTVRELLLEDKNKPGQRKVIDSYGEVYENHLKAQRNSSYTVTRTDYFGTASLPERGLFRYGVALGAWHDLATADPTLKTVGITVTSARVQFKKTINRAYIMKLPNGKQTTGAAIETQDNQGRVARRLIAITRQGKTIKIENMFYGPEGAMTPYTCLIPPDLNLKDVREFRLQTRPYTWAEFPDVALHPRP